jgi:hypothetical protein
MVVAEFVEFGIVGGIYLFEFVDRHFDVVVIGMINTRALEQLFQQ